MCLAQIVYQFYFYPYVQTRLVSDLAQARPLTLRSHTETSGIVLLKPFVRSVVDSSHCRPPRGRFSHLAMFRIGSLLYIPAYLSVVLYRVFASENDEGSLVLMAGASRGRHSPIVHSLAFLCQASRLARKPCALSFLRVEF